MTFIKYGFAACLSAALLSSCAATDTASQNKSPIVTIVSVVPTPVAPVDLVAILPAAPLPNSEADKADLATLLELQHSRTQAMCDRAKADVTISLKQFFRGMGINYEPALAPAVEDVFKLAEPVQHQASSTAKDYYKRLRPYDASADLVPCISKTPGSFAYPSGHTVWAYSTAILLVRMLPEKRDALFARAADYARQRMIGGVHYPSDVDAGRVGGTVVADHLLANINFVRKLDAATPELKRALGSQ